MYYKDYNHDTVMGAIDLAQQFIEQNPVENINFRLAGGLLGILAAVNEEVEWSYQVESHPGDGHGVCAQHADLRLGGRAH